MWALAKYKNDRDGAPSKVVREKKDAEKKEKRRLKAERSQSSELTIEESESDPDGLFAQGSSEQSAPETQLKKRAPPVPAAWARGEGSSVLGAGPEILPGVPPKRSGNKKGAAKPKVELDSQGVD